MNSFGEHPEFLDEVARVIGTHPNDLQAREDMGTLTDEDRAAAQKMNILMAQIVAANGLCVSIILTGRQISEDALRCCLSVPPDAAHEDITQRIMRHILDIKRISKEFQE